MRKMGGLRKYMPVTYWTMLVGSLALAGIPALAGFFSKDSIIEATRLSHITGSGFAYFSVLIGVFVTALYTFRMVFLTFHGKPRMDDDAIHHVKESPFVVTFPLVMLAIPSVFAGAVLIEPMLFGNLFGASLAVAPQHNVLAELGGRFKGIGPFIGHGLESLPFFLAVAGIITAWLFYIRYPHLPAVVSRKVRLIYMILVRKYYFDDVNDVVFAGGVRKIGRMFWRIGDVMLIDGLAVNGTARVIGWFASILRNVQTGYVYHYAFAMILGLFLLITFFLHR
jgi:NADH-quinone oxidoreductase subunit L